MNDENRRDEEQQGVGNNMAVDSTPNFILRNPEPVTQVIEEQQRQESYIPNSLPYVPMNQEPYGFAPQPEPEEKKDFTRKKQLVKKAGKISAAALLFGVIAGTTMAGINWVSDVYREKNQIRISQAGSIGSLSSVESTGGVNENPVMVMDVSAIVENSMPSVVAITNTVLLKSNSFFGQSQVYEVPSSGSGIIVGQNDDELLIVTNNHVVEGSKELSVVFIDDSSISAAIKGTDPETDLAVIAVPLKEIPEETLSKITIAKLGDSDSLKVGQGVVAIGNALGYGQSVTVGYVSALDREVKTDQGTSNQLLQTDAAINPGNSGGALLNMKGEVIGINAAKYSSTEVEGMGYAIPISKAQVIIDELMSKKTRVELSEKQQGYLGIQGTNIDDVKANELGMPRGVYIYKIVEGGAASKSDLREKDIITKFDGQGIRSMEDLKQMLTYYEGDSVVVLTVQSLENGEYVERQVEIRLDYRPVEQQVEQ